MRRCRNVAGLIAVFCALSCSGDKSKDTAVPLPKGMAETAAVADASNPIGGDAPSLAPAETPSVEDGADDLEGSTDQKGSELDENVQLVLDYSPAEIAATEEVFRDLGPLYIDPAALNKDPVARPLPAVWEAKTALPWSAYWYPKRGAEMFQGPASPLRKLDMYLNRSGIPSAIADWEEERYDGNAADWEGLCDSWAIAAISTVEPKASMRLADIDFTASDLKAIAIKYFEGYRPRVYGRRYLGLAETDGQMQDLRPEAFHRIAEVFLGQRGQAIVIDEDPGPEIWAKPLFRMAFHMNLDDEVPDAIRVKAYPWMIRQRSIVDEAPTSLLSDLAAPSYDYRLYYSRESDGRLRVVSGEWIGTSADTHPDMILIPEEAQNKSQLNPVMKAGADEIRKFLVEAGLFPS